MTRLSGALIGLGLIAKTWLDRRDQRGGLTIEHLWFVLGVVVMAGIAMVAVWLYVAARAGDYR